MRIGNDRRRAHLVVDSVADGMSNASPSMFVEYL
jgi:hypothetical protein